MRAIEWQDGQLRIIDQTALPHQLEHVRVDTVDALVEAIVALRVRGAPLLGAAGALGVVIALRQAEREGWPGERLAAEIERVRRARPTAVNLDVGVRAVLPLVPRGVAEVERAAVALLTELGTANRAMGERGADFLLAARGSGPLTVHTHCNTGELACGEWGTALGVIRSLHARGELAGVLVDETRPLLQGARLTAWELRELGIEHRLVCDGAGPFAIASGLADAVVVGADRIAANGDVANKIGTYSLALAAHAAGIPFVVAAPESTIDLDTPSGAAIPVEQRDEAEVTGFGGIRTAPEGTRALNLAFDVTPARYVTAIVTERRTITPSAAEFGMIAAVS